MNLIYLKYFCDAAKTGSISHSAKENFVSQSAISQGIHKLEKELGKELIVHRQNRFKITQEGEIVLARAREIFERVDALETALKAGKNEVAGRLEFASSHSFALAILPAVLKASKRLYPNLQVNFRLGHANFMKEWVRKGLVDFAIVLDNEDFSHFQCHELYKGQYRLYVSKKMEGQELPFILSEELMETNMLRKAYRKKFGKELPLLMQVSSWEVIAKLTEEGLGIGFFPEYVAASKKNLVEYSLKLDPIYYKVLAIFPENLPLRSSLQAFLEILKK